MDQKFEILLLKDIAKLCLCHSRRDASGHVEWPNAQCRGKRTNFLELQKTCVEIKILSLQKTSQNIRKGPPEQEFEEGHARNARVRRGIQGETS